MRFCTLLPRRKRVPREMRPKEPMVPLGTPPFGSPSSIVLVVRGSLRLRGLYRCLLLVFVTLLWDGFVGVTEVDCQGLSCVSLGGEIGAIGHGLCRFPRFPKPSRGLHRKTAEYVRDVGLVRIPPFYRIHLGCGIAVTSRL